MLDPDQPAPTVANEAVALIGRLVASGVVLDIDAGDLVFAGRRDALDAATIDALRVNKPMVIALLEQNRCRGVVKLGPTTLEQRRMEWRARSDRNAASYNVCLQITLTGSVDSLRLDAALAMLAVRHEILRTRFSWYGAHLLQEVMAPARTVLTKIEASVLSTLSDAAVMTWCERRGARAFDLASAPPARWDYAPTGPDRAVLLATFHHVACDGWSIERLLAELSHLYAGTDPTSVTSALPPIGFTPVDFARWEVGWLDPARVAPIRQAIAADLAGAQATPRFASGGNVPAVGGDARYAAVELGVALAARVEGLARAHRVSEFSLYFAVYAMLLREQTGDDCIVVVAVLNRTRSEHEDVVGLTRNACPIRCSARPDETIITIARRISDDIARASEHQWFPISLVELATESSIDPRKLPLTFGFASERDSTPSWNGAAITVKDVRTGAARAGFSLLVRRSDSDADASFEYSSDHFDLCDDIGIARRYGELVDEQVKRAELVPLSEC